MHYTHLGQPMRHKVVHVTVHKQAFIFSKFLNIYSTYNNQDTKQFIEEKEKWRNWIGAITKRSSEEVVIFISCKAAPFTALEIDETSSGLKSVNGTVGKSNSMKKPSCVSPFWISKPFDVLISVIFLAVRIPDSVTNSIVLEFTKPDVNSACAAANVAWPQSLTCKRVSNISRINYF